MNKENSISPSFAVELKPDITDLDHFGNDEQKNKIKELKRKIDELSENIQYLEKVSDTKERAIGTLARDKEKLASELRKERRASVNFRQQLDDERKFYLREKQTYCQEMNECKRNKKKHLMYPKNREEDKKMIESLQIDNTKLKGGLDEAVQTNYNLCVKFLRMKNTKDDLKRRFQRYQADQAKVQ